MVREQQDWVPGFRGKRMLMGEGCKVRGAMLLPACWGGSFPGALGAGLLGG